MTNWYYHRDKKPDSYVLCLHGRLMHDQQFGSAQLPTPSEWRTTFVESKSRHGRDSPWCNIGSSEQMIGALPNKEHQTAHKWRLRMKNNSCRQDGQCSWRRTASLSLWQLFLTDFSALISSTLSSDPNQEVQSSSWGLVELCPLSVHDWQDNPQCIISSLERRTMG